MSFNIEGTVHEPFPKIRIIGIVARLHAVEPLLRFLNDAYDNFSKKAAFALRKIRSELAIEMLMNRLKNTDYKICIDEAEALGKIGNECAVEPLIRLPNDADPMSVIAQWKRLAGHEVFVLTNSLLSTIWCGYRNVGSGC